MCAVTQVWLGIGDALSDAIERGQLDLLQQMYDEWPFFKGLLDLVEMVMAKADPRVTAMYDAKLVRPELQALGDELRAKFAATKTQVLEIVRHQDLLQDPADGASPELNEKIRLRAPYVAPLNVLQVQALRNLREFSVSDGSGARALYQPSESEIIELLSRDPHRDGKHPFQAAMDDTLMITIKGIAAGMQNTG
eukprot:GHRR01017052.1.p1 GENE.GHRR01017052.1~~GHRR01017052.1.p1  ORF type:complete len:194 (+),score=69.77 GHRR01017052.1:102-683(+)